MKKRTQISLDDWQYESLKAAAARDGRSLAGVVREAVTAYLAGAPDTSNSPLDAITGIGDDETTRGRNHDEALYGWASERSSES